MKDARVIAVGTCLLVAACLFALTVSLGSGGARSWMLPTFLAVVVIVVTAGMKLIARARRQRP